MDVFIQQLVNGIAVGGIYSLITIGFTIVYGILRMANFAHGDTFGLALFIGFSLYYSLHLHLIIVIAATVLACSFLAILVERLAYKPLRKADPTVSLLTALGAAFALRTIVEIVWGTKGLPFPSFGTSEVIEIGGIRFAAVNFFTLGVSIIVMICFNLFLKYHKQGKAIRSLAQDISVSSLVGIPISKTVSLVYGVGGALGAIGGLLWAGTYGVLNTNMGFYGLIKAFIICIVGGPGNLFGCVVSALLLGVIESLAAGFISSDYKDLIAYLFLIAILWFKPTGLFGGRIAEKV